MPRESANEWSCLFCGKGGFSSREAASECEREALLEFSNFPMHLLPPITQAIQGKQWALDPLVEGLFAFWSGNFVPGEPVGIQYPDSNPSLWPAKIISRDQSSIDSWYAQIIISQPQSGGTSGGEKIVVVRADAIQRCKPLLYSKRHIRQAIRVLTLPKNSYSEPYRIRPEYEAFLGIESAELTADLHDFLVDFIPNYHSVKRQKKLDAFFALPATSSGNSSSSVVPKPFLVQRPPFSKCPIASLSGDHLTWPVLQAWIWIVEFAGPLKIYPFKLPEWEYALADSDLSPSSNPIMGAVMVKMLKALQKERHDSGKQTLIALCSRLGVDGREFGPEDDDQGKNIPKWYMEKPNSRNWPFLLVSLLQEMTGWSVSFDWSCLAVGKKLQLVRLLQEMIIALPICKKAVDDWMAKAAENRKLRRSSEAERKRLQREIDKLPPLGPSSTSEERKALRALAKELEQAERTVSKCDSEAFRWNCHRLEPIASDSDGYLYWIVDYWGPNVYCGDAGRLYCSDPGRKVWGFWNRPDQIDELIGALGDRPGNQELKEALTDDYCEYLITGMNKYCYAVAQTATPLSGEEGVFRKSSSSGGGRRNILLDPAQSWLKYTNKWD